MVVSGFILGDPPYWLRVPPARPVGPRILQNRRMIPPRSAVRLFYYLDTEAALADSNLPNLGSPNLFS